jgi:hypothetical protein
MALRVYRDPDGGEWRVWRVVPDSVSFATLGESYREGWLCFERVNGTDRRRLSMAHVPTDWDGLADDRLDALRRLAEPATLRKVGVAQGADSDTDDVPRDRGRG